MMDDLYQEVILDHNKNPRNFGMINNSARSAEGFNPLCGDKVTVFVRVNPNTQTIDDLSFEGQGCAISTASASLMTEAVKGSTIEAAEKLFELFHSVVTNSVPPTDKQVDALGKLAVFEGVRDYPSRVKCATLVWHTLRSALSEDDQVVTTE